MTVSGVFDALTVVPIDGSVLSPAAASEVFSSLANKVY